MNRMDLRPQKSFDLQTSQTRNKADKMAAHWSFLQTGGKVQDFFHVVEPIYKLIGTLHRTMSLRTVSVCIQTIEICMIHLHNIKSALKGENSRWAKLVRKSQLIGTDVDFIGFCFFFLPSVQFICPEIAVSSKAVPVWCHQSPNTFRQRVRSLQPCGNITSRHAVSFSSWSRWDRPTQMKTPLILPALRFWVWKG